MKTIRYLFYCSVLTVVACNGKGGKVDVDSANANAIVIETKKSDKFIPYRLNETYTVIDTGCFDAMVYGGHYAVIKRDGYPADTIDLGVGMLKLNNGTYLFESVTDTAPPDDETSGDAECSKIIKGDIGSYFMVANGAKKKLNALLPDLDEYFSSPWVINGKIYYWQIKTVNPDSAKVISAAEYDPAKKSVKNHFVKKDYIESDDPGYFPNPYLKKDTIYFYFGENEQKKFSTDFKPYN